MDESATEKREVEAAGETPVRPEQVGEEKTGEEKAGEGAHPPGHYIPFRKADVIDMCLEEGKLAGDQEKSFREFTEILAALFHYEYHRRLESMLDGYAPFNPDADARAGTEIPEGERAERERVFVRTLGEVLTGANFRELEPEEILESINADPRLRIRLEVDMDDFAELLIFTRGSSTTKEVRRSFFGLVKKTETRACYDRVVIYLRLKDEAYFESKGRRDLAFKPGRSYLKLFRSVPREGLEMLFPNAKMKMRTLDKILIGVPAAFGGVMIVAKKLGATLILVFAFLAFYVGLAPTKAKLSQEHLVALGMGLFALGMYTSKQLSKYKKRKMNFLRSLSESLYYTVLDNNAGVLHHMIGAAEEEDCKEAILAYYFLLTRDGAASERDLDRLVESWFCERHGTSIDFEVDDAVGKLERLGLAERDGAALRAKPLEEAKKRLDYLWDNFFSYNALA